MDVRYVACSVVHGGGGRNGMNIFFLSLDPEDAARLHGDKHVVKMILESVQMLCTCQHVTGDPGWAARFLDSVGRPPCRPCYINHPCNVWLRESSHNYAWLCRLAASLCREKRIRWPASGGHVYENTIEWLSANPPSGLPSSLCFLTPPALAMPGEYKDGGGDSPPSLARAVRSYRSYYVYKASLGIVKYDRLPSREPYWLSRGIIT